MIFLKIHTADMVRLPTHNHHHTLDIWETEEDQDKILDFKPFSSDNS